MRTAVVAGLALLLGLVFGLVQAPAQTPNSNLALDLYQAAERAVSALPALAAPSALIGLARDEMASFPHQADADYAAAFALARALPNASSDPAIESVKEQTEVEAVGALARQGEAGPALALARQADVAQGPLYSQLIEAVPGTGQKSFDDAMALVEEATGDGSFPYRGAAAILRRRQISALRRMTLAQDGYSWAGNETQPARVSDAAFFLETGHEFFPSLDPQLESALNAMLQTLTQAGQSGVGGPLLSLLAEIDPAEAAAMGSVPPSVATSAAPAIAFSGDALNSIQGYLNGQSTGSSLAVQLNGAFYTFSNLGPTSDQANEAAGPAQFQALVNQASSLQGHDPSAALALANRASGLLDGAMLASQPEAATQLAQVYQALGAPADAARLLVRCLDAVDQAGAALDQTYWSAGVTAQTEMAEGLASAQTAITQVYAMAARIDLNTAAARAENSPMVLLKPSILARVALVAQLQGAPVVLEPKLPTPSAGAAR